MRVNTAHCSRAGVKAAAAVIGSVVIFTGVVFLRIINPCKPLYDGAPLKLLLGVASILSVALPIVAVATWADQCHNALVESQELLDFLGQTELSFSLGL